MGLMGFLRSRVTSNALVVNRMTAAIAGLLPLELNPSIGTRLYQLGELDAFGGNRKSDDSRNSNPKIQNLKSDFASWEENLGPDRCLDFCETGPVFAVTVRAQNPICDF